MSAKRSSSRVSVVLPPPERPTRPTCAPGAMRSEKRSSSSGWLGAYLKFDVAQLHAEIRRAEGLRGGGIHHARRIEQELGELGRVGQRAFEVAVDAVELPHHARRRRVVAERQEHRFEARAGPVADGERDEQAADVREHEHRRGQHVDARVLVVPGSQRLRAEVPDVALVDRRLLGFARERAHRFRIGDGIGEMPREQVRRRFADVHELPAPPNQRHHQPERGQQHCHQDDDEPRRVPPEHDAGEAERQEARRDLERHHVEHIFEPPGVSERALGERPRVVVVKEREILGEQLVHRLDVQRLQAADLDAGDQRHADAPARSGRTPTAR